MNIETGEIRDLDALTDKEKASGKWAPIPASIWKRLYAKGYTAKVPKSDEDFARILKADEKRKRRAAKRRSA